jgi:hypothetical protein
VTAAVAARAADLPPFHLPAEYRVVRLRRARAFIARAFFSIDKILEEDYESLTQIHDKLLIILVFSRFS